MAEQAIADVARFLREAFGPKLTAYIASVTDPKAVAKWASGEHAPRPDAQERLRVAFQIFHMLQDRESPHTVRAWFVGLNPQLDDESPATAIQEGRFKDAMVAARAFLAGG